VREILATELLEARGVATSKSFSLIETGEQLMRGDEPSPTRSAVLTRLSHGHVRIGSFQRLRALDETEALKRLTDHAIETYWPTAAEAADPIAALFGRVVAAVAEMGAGWMAAGFVHGVLNSDNIAITGESFDYGPWRVQERFEPGRVAAYFDHAGLYAYARQPEALHWNLARFAECLLPFSSVDVLEPLLKDFADLYARALTRRTLWRLGLDPEDSQDAKGLSDAFWQAMAETRPDFERSFFDLIGGAERARIEASPQAGLYAHAPWAELIARLRDQPLRTDPTDDAAAPFRQLAAPADLPIERVEAIWAAIDRDDDWQPLFDAVAELRASGNAYPAPDAAPRPGAGEKAGG
jgi:uncharacterized protein YdiU (UPF0061 family)